MNFTIKQIGKTVLGQAIDCWFSKSTSGLKILIVGGVHGDEKEGIEIANGLIKKLLDKNILSTLAIIPCLNRDGELLNLRSNYNNVDLNRNIPTTNWTEKFTNPRYNPGAAAASEPETQSFMSLLDSFKPDLIISLHSYSESLILYGPGSGRFDEEVQSLATNLNLKLVPKMSYEVTGSLNTLSAERQVPTITIEAPRDESWIGLSEKFILGIEAFLKTLS